MKKKLLVVLLVLVVLITGCSKKDIKEDDVKVNENAIKFKEEYEGLNGKAGSGGRLYRNVSISEDNPFIKVKPEEIVKMLEEKKSFYLYVGDEMCPWCRSVIEKSIEIAKENYIDKIYYIEIWDENHNEILRDKYELDKKNKPKLVQEGTDSYKALLKAFKNVLEDYTLTTDKDKKVKVGEKRIFAPNFFYVVEGEVQSMVDGISERQTDAYMELSDEILLDQKDEFTRIFSTACDEECE